LRLGCASGEQNGDTERQQSQNHRMSPEPRLRQVGPRVSICEAAACSRFGALH
jgi:hypothetical protein